MPETEPTQAELDQQEVTVNVVHPDSWDSANPRMIDPEQSG